MKSNLALFRDRRFFPLFMTQFLGAFNDNLFKNAMIMIVVFHFSAEGQASPQVFVTLAAGIFILPFFLFSALAGQIADKFDKARIARYVKVSEIAFMALAAAGFFSGNIWLLLGVLFLMGTHSAFFGPVKYAVLPQHLSADELLAGNAFVEAGTFIGILLGTIFAGLIALHDLAPEIASIAVILTAIAGYLFSCRIPSAPGQAPGIVISYNLWRETGALFRLIRQDRVTFRAVLCISWFWLLGATYLTQFPALVRDHMAGGELMVTGMMTIFSVGIALGSFLCNRLLKGEIRTDYAPWAALGMAIFGADLFFCAGGSGVRLQVFADLFAISLCGGVFVVPFYALVQRRADPTNISRTIAGLNVMNALFMVGSSVFAALLLALSFSIPQVLLMAALCNIPVAVSLFYSNNKP